MDLLASGAYSASAATSPTAVNTYFNQQVAVQPGSKGVRVDFVVVDVSGFQTGAVQTAAMFLARSQAIADNANLTQLDLDYDLGGAQGAFSYSGPPFDLGVTTWFLFRLTHINPATVTGSFGVVGEYL